ncbi:MAG: GNAT family N-acetyltransferase [Chloroflexota bacterium]
MTFAIRVATVADAPIIVAHRRAMFEDMGERAQDKLDALSAAFETWVTERLARGEYHGWLAMDAQNQVIAGAGLWLLAWPSTPHDQSAQRGYIFNVYTQPVFRRRGLARQLMHVILDWCRAQSIRVVGLHASDDGRALYEALGFKPTNEMRLKL